MTTSEHNGIVRYEPDGTLSGDWAGSQSSSSLGACDAHVPGYLYALEGHSDHVDVIVEIDNQNVGVAGTLPLDFFASDVAVDSDHNVYVTDVLASFEKYSRTGQRVFSQSWPGGLDAVLGIYVDGSDHVYLVGSTFQSGTTTGVLVEFDSYGNVLAEWITSTVYHYVAVDGLGNLYLAAYGQTEVDKFSNSGQNLATITSPGLKTVIGLEVSPSGTV